MYASPGSPPGPPHLIVVNLAEAKKKLSAARSKARRVADGPPKWTAPPMWKGQFAFVIGGGPSVKPEHVEMIKGHKVVVINSSYEIAPWADILFFGDTRWWMHNQKDVLSKFRNGMMITVSRSVKHPRVKNMARCAPPGLTDIPSVLTMERTSLTAVLNLMKHFKVRGIGLLGIDNKTQGRQVHHHTPHPWAQRPGWELAQRNELKSTVIPLQDEGIKVWNLSPVSAIDFWPHRTLQEVLNVEGVSRQSL